MQNFRLTSYSHGSGCGCKISPAVLKTILGSDHNKHFDKLLVGFDSNDDAAVLDIGSGQGLISTTDFFMPIVDDSYSFGTIAAANAISDVYAMGGKPILAVAILGWPIDKLPAELAQNVLNGARSICKEAGIPLAGGHSIDSPEPIFGLAVNGVVNISNIKKNNTARPGDYLFLTKPLGFGIITTAAKRGLALEDDLNRVVMYMSTLNKIGEALATQVTVHAMTDVTGFGFLGHCIEMAEGSGLSAEIDFAKLPMLPNLKYYLDKYIYPDMTMKNYSTYSDKVNEPDALQLFTTCDPQTSGGLLIAVAPEGVEAYVETAKQFSIHESLLNPVGRLTAPTGKVIILN